MDAKINLDLGYDAQEASKKAEHERSRRRHETTTDHGHKSHNPIISKRDNEEEVPIEFIVALCTGALCCLLRFMELPVL